MRSRARPKATPSALTLVLSSSTDATADYLCSRFEQAGVAYRRFDTDQALDTVLVMMSDHGMELSWGAGNLRPGEINAVIYRRPSPFVPPIEGDRFQLNHAADEWAEAVEGFLAHVPAAKWLNHPALNFGASHKIHQLTRARRCGLLTPPWVATTVPNEARRFVASYGPDVVVKPLASGYIERDDPRDDTVIFTSTVENMDSEWFGHVPACPVLFQTRVQKRVDVRVTVVDRRMVAVALEAKQANGAQQIDIRRDNMRDVNYAPILIPKDVAKGIAAVMARYRLRFAAIDFAVDVDERWFFFEINPNGQWAWLDLMGATDIGQLFVDAVCPSKGNA